MKRKESENMYHRKKPYKSGIKNIEGKNKHDIGIDAHKLRSSLFVNDT